MWEISLIKLIRAKSGISKLFIAPWKLCRYNGTEALGNTYNKILNLCFWRRQVIISMTIFGSKVYFFGIESIQSIDFVRKAADIYS